MLLQHYEDTSKIFLFSSYFSLSIQQPVPSSLLAKSQVSTTILAMLGEMHSSIVLETTRITFSAKLLQRKTVQLDAILSSLVSPCFRALEEVTTRLANQVRPVSARIWKPMSKMAAVWWRQLERATESASLAFAVSTTHLLSIVAPPTSCTFT